MIWLPVDTELWGSYWTTKNTSTVRSQAKPSLTLGVWALLEAWEKLLSLPSGNNSYSSAIIWRKVIGHSDVHKHTSDSYFGLLSGSFFFQNRYYSIMTTVFMNRFIRKPSVYTLENRRMKFQKKHLISLHKYTGPINAPWLLE